MWFRFTIEKTAIFAFLLFLMLATSNCTKNKNSTPIIGSFDTNGKIFAYSTPENGLLQKIHFTNQDGAIFKTMETPNRSIGEVHFGKKNFYYVEYDVERKYSKIISCKLIFDDCNPIYEIHGSIRHPIELDEKTLLFIRSHVKPETHHDSGYAHFKFYKYDIETKKITWLIGQDFMASGPIYKVREKIYYSALYGDEKIDINSNGYVQSRNDYNFNINAKKVKRNRNNIKLDGSFYIVSSVIINGNHVYYLGDSTYGNYIYKTCVRKEKDNRNCSISRTNTTIPAFVGNNVYYGIWDFTETKLKIVSVTLGGASDG